jgi:glycosyltransferase involved in cell wall biosynthesis
MKVLLLGLEWFPGRTGGSNRYFRELLVRLPDAGVAVEGVAVGETDLRRSAAVAAAPDDPLPRRLTRFKSVAERLGKSADVVDVHFALYALLPVVFGRLRRKPLVVHFHGPWADESIAAGQQIAAALIKRRVERMLYRRAEAAITLSGAFKRILVERYRVPPWKIAVVPPGVDLLRFRPADPAEARSKLGVDPRLRLVCTVRRLTPRTGVDLLLEAFAQLDGDRLLLVAGEGPERHRLETLASELGISASVRFLGRVDEDELAPLYQAADVTVVPSRRLEGFGLTVLESLACGTPVVATDVGGLREVLGRIDPTCVVPAGDVGALAERLAGTLPDRTSCRAAAEHSSWDECLQRHVQIYRDAGRQVRERPIRVVYIDHTAKLSGAELALARVLPGLDGIDSHVILGSDGPLVARLIDAEISVEVMPLANETGMLGRERARLAIAISGPGIGAAIHVLRLAWRLRQLRPDVVHTNSLKAALYGGLAARLAGVRVVSHAHDRLADDYLPPEAARLARFAYTRLSHAVIAPSRAVADTLPVPSHVVPWPVFVSGEPRTADARPFTAGIVGRIAPWKGQHLFIEAFARVLGRGDAEGRIIGAPLFGAEEEEYLDRLRGQADGLGLDGRLRFTGFVDDVSRELASLDVLVHASTIPEPFGQVVLEGMAAGVPVIASAPGGPAELIADGVDGLLFPAGDVDALCDRLQRVASDAALRERLRDGGRAKAAGFTLPATAMRISEIYRQVSTTPGRPLVAPA